MVNISRSHNNDVFSHVIAVVIVLDHLLIDSFHVGEVAQNGQAYLLSLEDASVRDFDGRLQRLRLPRFEQLPMDGAAFIVHILPAIQ